MILKRARHAQQQSIDQGREGEGENTRLPTLYGSLYEKDKKKTGSIGFQDDYGLESKSESGLKKI